MPAVEDENDSDNFRQAVQGHPHLGPDVPLVHGRLSVTLGRRLSTGLGGHPIFPPTTATPSVFEQRKRSEFQGFNNYATKA